MAFTDHQTSIMDRRTFIYDLGLAGLSLSSAVHFDWNNHADYDALIGQLIAQNDQSIALLTNRQEQNPQHRWYGGIKDRYKIATPMGTASAIRAMVIGWIQQPSKYHQDQSLLTAIDLAADYLLRVQHQDGTIDLLSTNFHSTPDTGFVVEPLTIAYTLLDRSKKEAAQSVLEKLAQFLRPAGDMLAKGGIHTPNHRWVVCMALSRINQLFPKQIYLDRIEAWLNEGIDIDPDGQYTEKSTSIYSPLTNRCLITVARILDKPELYEPVRRNLDMTLYYLHANGEIVTDASSRQDQFRIAFPQQYYYSYRYMALLDGNAQFGEMAKKLAQQMPERLTAQLGYLLESPFLQTTPSDGVPLPQKYTKAFPHSNVVRIRNGQWDATILGDNPNFFSFFNGMAALQAVRLSMAFFGKGAFSSKMIQTQDHQYQLTWTLSKGYYQLYPLDQLPENGDWEKMPRQNRPLSEEQHLSAVITITQKEDQFTLDFDIQGTKDVPIAIECAFRNGGQLANVQTVAHTGNTFLLPKDTHALYTYGQDGIRIGPGCDDHEWTVLRGGLPKLEALSLFLTGFTPFKHQLLISGH